MATRAYSQHARAESTARTRESVLDAVRSLVWDDLCFDPSLDQVAERAGVTTRTVLRHFGSKDELLETARVESEAAVVESRVAPPGDIPTAMRRLVDHYEELGDRVLGMLALERRRPEVEAATDSGKELHRRWVEEVFAHDLEGLGHAGRDRRVALLATVTDLYVWALLRRRYGLSRKSTEAAMRGLVEHVRGDSR